MQCHKMVVVQSTKPTEALWYLILGCINNIDLTCGQDRLFCDGINGGGEEQEHLIRTMTNLMYGF